MNAAAITCCCLFLATAPWAQASGPQLGEHPAPYRLVLDAACAALPEEPHDFLVLHRAAIEDAIWLRPAVLPDGDSAAVVDATHFILLDAAAGDSADTVERIRMATEFPHGRKAARDLFEAHGVHTGGELPWLIDEQFGKLLQALRKGDSASAARQVGVIVHLAAGASLPFNTTTLALDELGAAPAGGGRPAVPTRRFRERFHGAFIERLKDRLAYEVRVAPGRVQSISSPLDAAFATLLQSHRVAQELAVIDTEAIRRLGVDDVTAFASSADVYSAALAERVAPLLETQLESGALLAANLINTAWTTARPTFADTRPKTEPAAEGTGPAPTPAGDVTTPVAQPAIDATIASSLLVGSLGSTVYHRADCSHVARIKLAHRVDFKTKAEADASGRKPCHACKPDVEGPLTKRQDKK